MGLATRSSGSIDVRVGGKNLQSGSPVGLRDGRASRSPDPVPAREPTLDRVEGEFQGALVGEGSLPRVTGPQRALSALVGEPRRGGAASRAGVLGYSVELFAPASARRCRGLLRTRVFGGQTFAVTVDA
jgi:hypothetical protein